MIFKTITDKTTLSGQRIVGALQARKIAQQQATAQLEIDITCLKEYQVACQNGTVTTEQFDVIMHKASASAVEYSAKVKAGTGTAQSYANAQRATNSALQEVSIGAGIASKAVKLFSTALNMIAFTAIIQGISWLIGKVDEWIVTAKEAKESADAFKQSLSTFFNETQTNLKTISSLSDRFNELSKNVDDNGKKVSGTEEEYAEFLDICQQVEQIMPELITGYTNEGEAIIALQGKVDSLTDSYKEAIKAKASLFISKGDEEGNTIDSFFEDYDNFINGYKGLWDLKTSPSGQNSLEDFEEYYGYDKIHEWLSKVKDASLNELNNLEGELATAQRGYMYIAKILDDSDFDITNITEENYNAIHDVLNNRFTVMEKELSDRVINIRSAFQNMLYADSDYWNIDDENVISAINSLYNSIDAEFIKQNSLFDQNALQTFESNFISLFNNDDIKQAMVDFYMPITAEDSINDYAEKVKSAIETIQIYCEKNRIKIPIEISDNNTVNIANRLRNSIRKITDDHGITDRDEYAYLVNEIDFQSFTQEQAELWLTSTSGAENATDAVKRFRDALALAESEGDDPLTFSSVLSDESLSKFQSTIDSIKSSLTTLYNGDYSSTELISALTSINKAMSDIGKPESVNWEEITNIDDLDNIIDQITNEYVDGMLDSLDMAGTEFGNTIRNVIQEELKASRQLETYKSNVSDLQSAYSNLTDVIETYNANGYITFDQLTSLLEMEPQYLSCLINENGQLQLNEQAMADLAHLRLDEARAQVVQEAISELNRLSEEEQTQSVNDNSTAYLQNIKTISKWNHALSIAMQNAGLAAPLFAELSTALGGAVSNGASDDDINQVLDNAYKKFQMIGQVESSIGSNLGGVLGKTSSSSGSTSSSTDNYEEQFDFFERRVEVLDNAVNLLKTNLENLTGSFAKNQILDQSSSILEERMRNYSDAVKIYQEKAQESLSKLDLETQKKIIDGSVSLTDYIGEGNKAVVEAMNDYKGWSDKVAECTEELASLKEELRQLELDKFNHIIQDFTDQFDLRDNAKNLIDKQIALFKEAGQLIGKSFYEEQIDQSQKQLSLLENEKAQLVNQMTSAIGSGRVNFCPLLQ